MPKIDPALERTGLPPAPPMWAAEWSGPSEVGLRDDGSLVYEGDKVVKADSGSALLFEFATLDQRSDLWIVRFARRWGVLGICAHGVPATHVPQRLRLELGDDFRPCEPMRNGLSRYRLEPISAWRRYSRHAHALIRAVPFIQEGARVPADCWEDLADLYPSKDYVAPVTAARNDLEAKVRGLEPIEASEKRLMHSAFQRWLDLGDVRVQFNWRSKHPHVEFGNASLFGALAVQLSLVAANVVGLFICALCNEPFIPEEGRKRPRAGERHYCDECRERGSAARAKGAEASRGSRRPKPPAPEQPLINFD